MNCKKCGTLLPENVAFCTSCGEKVEQNATQAATPAVEIRPLEGEKQTTEAQVAEQTPVQPSEAPVVQQTPVQPVEAQVAQQTPVQPSEAPVAEHTPVQPVEAPVAQQASAQPVEAQVAQQAPVQTAVPQSAQVGYGVQSSQSTPAQPVGYVQNNNNNNVSTNKKNSSIIFIAIAAVLLIIIGVLVYMLVIKDNSAKVPEKTTTTTKEIEETKKTTSTTTTQTTTKQVAVNNNQVDMYGILTVDVPEKFIAELEPESELLAFYDKDTNGKTEAIALTAYEDGFYDMLSDNREAVKQKIEARNGTNTRISFGQTEDFNNITISYTINGTNVTEVALSKPDFDYDLYFVGIGTSSLTSDDIRTDIVNIVYNIKLNTSSNFASEDIKYKNKPIEYDLPNMSLNQE